MSQFYISALLRTIGAKVSQLTPPFDASLNQRCSSKCKMHTKQFIESLQNFDLWAYQSKYRLEVEVRCVPFALLLFAKNSNCGDLNETLTHCIDHMVRSINGIEFSRAQLTSMKWDKRVWYFFFRSFGLSNKYNNNVLKLTSVFSYFFFNFTQCTMHRQKFLLAFWTVTWISTVTLISVWMPSLQMMSSAANIAWPMYSSVFPINYNNWNAYKNLCNRMMPLWTTSMT